MRHVVSRLLLLVAVGGFAVLGSGHAGAGVPASTRAAGVSVCDASTIESVGDLDGDGVPEIVVGLPTYPGGGAVDVRYTAGGGVVLTAAGLGLPGVGASDRFGGAVVVTELNGDRCADLVIGAPGHAGVGAVVIAMGSPEGYAAADVTVVPTPTRKAGAAFGSSLALDSVFVNGSWQPELGVGMPGYPVNGRSAAGAVVRLLILDGLPGPPVVATEDTPGVPGVSETGDRFGSVLAGGGNLGFGVGTPLEDIGRLTDAGTVTLLHFWNGQWGGEMLSESTPWVPGVVEAGDRFGAAVSNYGISLGLDVNNTHVTIGIPGEDIGSHRDAGSVVSMVTPGEDSHLYPSVLLHQDGAWLGSPVPGSNERGDAFGSSLAWSDSSPDRMPLVVGVPGEDIGDTVDAGRLATFDIGRPVLGTMTSVTESSGGFRGHVEAGDRFGATLASGWSRTIGDPSDLFLNRLLVGIPGEDVRSARDAGAVAVSDDRGRSRIVTLSRGERTALGYGTVLGTPSGLPAN